MKLLADLRTLSKWLKVAFSHSRLSLSWCPHLPCLFGVDVLVFAVALLAIGALVCHDCVMIYRCSWFPSHSRVCCLGVPVWHGCAACNCFLLAMTVWCDSVFVFLCASPVCVCLWCSWVFYGPVCQYCSAFAAPGFIIITSLRCSLLCCSSVPFSYNFSLAPLSKVLLLAFLRKCDMRLSDCWGDVALQLRVGLGSCRAKGQN